jgi:hypothetical protein
VWVPEQCLHGISIVEDSTAGSGSTRVSLTADAGKQPRNQQELTGNGDDLSVFFHVLAWPERTSIGVSDLTQTLSKSSCRTYSGSQKQDLPDFHCGKGFNLQPPAIMLRYHLV